MSATNRGAKRKECDFYATPKDVIYNILENFDLNTYGNKVLEPSAGNGNISSVIRELYPDKHITSLELREEERENLKTCSDEVIIGNFLNLDLYNKYDIIIGNPPYSLAIKFVNKSLQCLENGGY